MKSCIKYVIYCRQQERSNSIQKKKLALLSDETCSCSFKDFHAPRLVKEKKDRNKEKGKTDRTKEYEVKGETKKKGVSLSWHDEERDVFKT